MIFPYELYLQFITHAKSYGNIVRMRDTTYEAGEIILRHDVDLDIKPAFDLSKLEQEAGIRSTFFILTTCHSYNPGSPVNRKMLRELAEADFEIGLHFDPSVYGNATEGELESFAKQEANWLTTITGKPVLSVSIHTPSIHGVYPIFQSFRNAYDTRIFNDEIYMSDSRMNFRGKDPFEFVKRVSSSAIQVLLHPMHFTDDGKPYPFMYLDYIRSHINFIDAEHTIVNSGYAASKSTTLLETFMNGKNESQG